MLIMKFGYTSVRTHIAYGESARIASEKPG